VAIRVEAPRQLAVALFEESKVHPKAPGDPQDFEDVAQGSRPFPGEPVASAGSYAQTLKESPQPQDFFALGFSSLKPDSISPVWYLSSVPIRKM